MKNQNIKNLNKITKGYFNVPIKGNSEADEVWNILFTRNFKDLENKGHSLFLNGLKELSIDEKHVPKLEDLHGKINQKTGWKLKPTDDEYSDSETWFQHLEQKLFLVTKVIRSKENLDYTPFPEAFHDIFGHLPFLVGERYVNLINKFALKYNALSSKESKQKFANFWWYVIEFGLMREGGEIKAFGAGLMSSFGERQHAFSDKVMLRNFDVIEMQNTAISDHEFHDKLFVIDSLDQVEQAVDDWV